MHNVLELCEADGTENIGNSLRAGSRVDPTTFASIRRHVLLNGCKWDPQVGDHCTLESFPLLLKASVWKVLSHQAELLTSEAILAEEEISQHPALLKRLGLPAALSNVLGQKIPPTPEAGRIIRFDFHLTTEGWRISEANSDVPGGFTEASCFTQAMAGCFPQLRVSGDPAGDWTQCLAKAASQSGVVALLSAPGYSEDHQVVAYLASCLRKYGCITHLAKPEQIVWRDGTAFLETAWHTGPLNAIVRFYQAEWLCRSPQPMQWEYSFRGGKTPVANSALAVISESKRFPVVWDELSAKLPTWRALLPETRDPREIPRNMNDDWLLKTAMCNTGDAVSKREWMKPVDWKRTQVKVLFAPHEWVAQRRFESVPIATPVGLRHACVGIYTVNGKAAGTYARLSKAPVINYLATDVSLLLETDD